MITSLNQYVGNSLHTNQEVPPCLTENHSTTTTYLGVELEEPPRSRTKRSRLKTRKVRKAAAKKDNISDKNRGRISAKNPRFAENLKGHGPEMRTMLQESIATPPNQRTQPMPGVEKVCHQIRNFIQNTILTDQNVSDANKRLYKAHLKSLERLEKRGFPWKEAFTLTYKSTHMISFYHKDKVDTSRHRSHYLPETTLEDLCDLPWGDSLENPISFREKLQKHWTAHHLKFPNSMRPLDRLQAYCYTCSDELDLDYFNRTWMLGIFPLGFFTDPEILFDGFYGFCADFFEHDILHCAYAKHLSPKLWLPTKVLLDNQKRIFFNRSDDPQSSTLHTPSEAMELLLFEIHHERNENCTQLTEAELLEKAKDVFNRNQTRLRGVYSNLDKRYHQVTLMEVEMAAEVLHLLNQKRFWDCETEEQAMDILQGVRQSCLEWRIGLEEGVAYPSSDDNSGVVTFKKDNGTTEINIVTPQAHRVIKPVTSFKFDEEHQLMVFETPEETGFIRLNGKSGPTLYNFRRDVCQSVQLMEEEQAIWLYTKRGIEAVPLKEHGPIAPASTKLKYFNNAIFAFDFKVHDFSHSVFHRCDLSEATLSWENIKHCTFQGYSYKDKTKLKPAIEAAQQWVSQSDKDFQKRVMDVQKSGLLPYMELSDEQFLQLQSMKPWSESSSSLSHDQVPFRALVSQPDRITGHLALSLRDALASDEGMCLPSFQKGEVPESCLDKSYPIVREFIKALDGPNDIRQMIQLNPQLDEGTVTCFDGLSFNPFTLKTLPNENLRSSALHNMSFKNANLQECNLSFITLNECNFSGANMEGCSMIATRMLRNCRFDHTSLRDSCLMGANIGCESKEADGFKCSFYGADMKGSNLSCSVLGNCYLNDVCLDDSQLRSVEVLGELTIDNTSLNGSNVKTLESSNCGRRLIRASQETRHCPEIIWDVRLAQIEKLLATGKPEDRALALARFKDIPILDLVLPRQRDHLLRLIEQAN